MPLYPVVNCDDIDHFHQQHLWSMWTPVKGSDTWYLCPGNTFHEV